VPANRSLPLWAQRLIELRRARMWSAADLALELKKLRDDLPAAKSLTHMIQMDWETGKHRPGPRYRLLLAAIYDTDEHEIFSDPSPPAIGPERSVAATQPGPVAVADVLDPLHPAELTSWITATNTSNAAIEHIERVANSLAGIHTQLPDRQVLAGVMRLHCAAQRLLRSGRQRLRQTRDLVRLDGVIQAHASVLFSDLGENQAAEDYGHTALLYLQEADASPATAWYALAKTARWEHNYAAAVDFARQGLEPGLVTPMTAQLASYQANAAALLGDQATARLTLAQAETFAQQLPTDGEQLSPWSFPPSRQAIFKLSVLLRTGDPDGALRIAADAEGNWAIGQPRNTWTWALIRIGAAIACLRKRSLDGAIDQVAPVLELAPDMRITTVTGWLADLDRELALPQLAASPTAVSLRQQIREFTAAALQKSE
jgi:hypothetical protein